MKEASPTATVARRGTTLQLASGSQYVVQPRSAQLFLEEEGARADQVVSITKFQNFVLTLVVAFAYGVLTIKAHAYAPLPPRVLWLLGISHAGSVLGTTPIMRAPRGFQARASNPRHVGSP